MHGQMRIVDLDDDVLPLRQALLDRIETLEKRLTDISTLSTAASENTSTRSTTTTSISASVNPRSPPPAR